MTLKTNQITKIMRLHNAGFGLHDICQLSGFDRATVKWALAPERELERTAKYLLKRCPRGRDPAEHERIVRACFGV